MQLMAAVMFATSLKIAASHARDVARTPVAP
jgi:hypothetical protein